MKFCYIDESGFGAEPYAVMVGIIVDASRMHLAKSEWNGLLALLSRLIRRTIPEIHACDFYPGNGVWRGLSGDQRSRVAAAIFHWLNDRKHLIIYSAIDKGLYNAKLNDGSMPREIDTPWKFLALHLTLGIQKNFQSMRNNKGNTVLVFDNNERNSHSFCDLIDNPPSWTDAYYGKGPRQDRLDQIIDVPFFVDSRHASLIQMADFSAYFLRRYAEIMTGTIPSRYRDEQSKVEGWIRLLCQRCIPLTSTYPRRGRNTAQDLFWSLSPECLRSGRLRILGGR